MAAPFTSSDVLSRATRLLSRKDGTLALATVAVVPLPAYPITAYDRHKIFVAYLVFDQFVGSAASATISFGHDAAGTDWNTGLVVGGAGAADQAYPPSLTAVIAIPGGVPRISVTGGGSGVCRVSCWGWSM